jgi:hypothetical protein
VGIAAAGKTQREVVGLLGVSANTVGRTLIFPFYAFSQH